MIKSEPRFQGGDLCYLKLIVNINAWFEPRLTFGSKLILVMNLDSVGSFKKNNPFYAFILNLICLGESACYVFLIIFPFTLNCIMIERERESVLFLYCFLLPFNHGSREKESRCHLYDRHHHCVSVAATGRKRAPAAF